MTYGPFTLTGNGSGTKIDGITVGTQSRNPNNQIGVNTDGTSFK